MIKKGGVGMYIKVNGVELFYEKEGSGPPLVLVHGNGEDHFIFDQCTKALSGSFTVYRPDSRGHGKSSRVPKLHYQDMADDMVLFIKELELSQPFFTASATEGSSGFSWHLSTRTFCPGSWSAEQT